jgi:hypothetical protein
VISLQGLLGYLGRPVKNIMNWSVNAKGRIYIQIES